MRHVVMTCKHHPNLRWNAKDIACNSTGKAGDPALYNGSRHIFFVGTPVRNADGSAKMHADMSGVECTWQGGECDCPPTDLIIAPEDSLVRREAA